VSLAFLNVGSGHYQPLIVAVLLFSVGYAGVGAALACRSRAGRRVHGVTRDAPLRGLLSQISLDSAS
jgi:hypothetical protein